MLTGVQTCAFRSRLAALTHPATGRVEIGRDAIGRITSVHGRDLEATWTWRDGTVAACRVDRRGFIQSTLLERDADDRVIAQTTDGVRTAFSYDAAGRLTSSTGPGGRTVYTYDAEGRRTRESGPEGSCPGSLGCPATAASPPTRPCS